MSAYLCSSDTLSALATYWAGNLRRDEQVLEIARAIYRGSHQPSWPEATQRAQALTTAHLPAVVVYEMLLDENKASLEARYPELHQEFNSAGYRFTPDPQVTRDLLSKRTGWIVSLLDGYEYQSCEHGGWRHSIGQALCHQIRRRLTEDLLAAQDPERKHRYWASYDRNVWQAKTEVIAIA